MNSDKPEGALRLYRRGWRSTCRYSGTATPSEFWWFTLINAVVYACFQFGTVRLFMVVVDWMSGGDPTYHDPVMVLR